MMGEDPGNICLKPLRRTVYQRHGVREGRITTEYFLLFFFLDIGAKEKKREPVRMGWKSGACWFSHHTHPTGRGNRNTHSSSRPTYTLSSKGGVLTHCIYSCLKMGKIHPNYNRDNKLKHSAYLLFPFHFLAQVTLAFTHASSY